MAIAVRRIISASAYRFGRYCFGAMILLMMLWGCSYIFEVSWTQHDHRARLEWSWAKHSALTVRNDAGCHIVNGMLYWNPLPVESYRYYRYGSFLSAPSQADTDFTSLGIRSVEVYQPAVYLASEPLKLAAVFIAFPLWFPVLMAMAPAVCWLSVARQRWQANRWRTKGLCPICGYDIRASVGRCPECGASVFNEANDRRRKAA